MILCQEPAKGFGQIDKVDKFVFVALPCFFLFFSFLFFGSSPTSTLLVLYFCPEIKAAVYSCLDYALHKGTVHKGVTSYIVCIIHLYIFYKFLKYSTKVSWPKQTNMI